MAVLSSQQGTDSLLRGKVSGTWTEAFPEMIEKRWDSRSSKGEAVQESVLGDRGKIVDRDCLG